MDSKEVAVPDLVRKVLHSQLSSRCGNWSDGTVDVSLNLGSVDEVDCIWMTITGDDCSCNRIVAMLRGIAGWSIASPEALEVVDVRAPDQIRNDGRAALYFDEGDITADT